MGYVGKRAAAVLPNKHAFVPLVASYINMYVRFRRGWIHLRERASRDQCASFFCLLLFWYLARVAMMSECEERSRTSVAASC